MAFSEEDLRVLGSFVKSEVEAAVGAMKAEAPAAAAAAVDRVAVVGSPDVAPDAGPLYWLHLADGSVIESHDSSSTHVDVDGASVPVIGRFQKGA